MSDYSKYAKFLISLLIAASLIFGLCQGVPGTAPGQPVVGEITLRPGSKPNVAIADSLDISDWDLVPGEVNQRMGILHIHVSSKWQISVSADPDTSGYMTEYTSAYKRGKKSGYVEGGERLKNSMKIKAQGYNEVDLAQGGVLIPHGSAGEFNIPITISQMVTWDDSPLSNGHIYHIAIKIIRSKVKNA